MKHVPVALQGCRGSSLARGMVGSREFSEGSLLLINYLNPEVVETATIYKYVDLITYRTRFKSKFIKENIVLLSFYSMCTHQLPIALAFIGG